ncbi:MAG: CapA family protein [Clostridia bacterium]|nr:CapA family protein [Clostridia bacterium]
MKILIGADLVPTKRNMALFAEANVEELLGAPLKALLENASYRIFNLETPLTDRETPIAKCGPALRAETATVAAIKRFGVDFFTLANNHILDHGEEGLTFTLDVLDTAGIAYAGVGKTLAKASRPHLVAVDGKILGIYCCAEHEFSIATEDAAGANPYDPLESFDHVRSLREQCDYLIVLYHGGKEYCRYPSPGVRKLCRKFVDCGADIVLCQHTHCIGCEEDYKDKKIVYGQGNFLFDHSEKEEWQTGLLVECDISDAGVTVSYHPLRKHGNKVRLADTEDARTILEAFYARSQELLSDETWKAKYAEFAKASRKQLLLRVNGRLCHSFIFRVCMRLFGEKFLNYYLTHSYDKNALLVLQNTIESESWRELLLEAIQAE